MGSLGANHSNSECNLPGLGIGNYLKRWISPCGTVGLVYMPLDSVL